MPTLYDNFNRVKEWAVDKFQDKEALAAALADVALSGDYNDLINKPDLSTYATQAYVMQKIDEIPGTDLTGYATESYVTSKVSELVGSAPTTLDTLNELAAALGDDPNFATTIATQMGSKANSSDVYTKNEINAMSYVSNTDLNTRLNTASYISSIPAEYVTDSELSVTLNDYVTESELSSMSYATPLTQTQMDTLFPIS